MTRVQKVLFSVLVLSMMACSEQRDESVATQEGGDAELQVTENIAIHADKNIVMDVYKSPTCGCCGKWVEHAEERGFSLTTHHPTDFNQFKKEQGIEPEYQSCHTSVSEQGYIFEGHVPARYIREFLAAPPVDARGLAVPAMPMGSPGMEMDDRFMAYQVLLLKKDSSVEVYAEVSSPDQQYE